MKARALWVGLSLSLAVPVVFFAGCSDDVVNNNSYLLPPDSGIDVLGALSTLGCTAAAKECVTDSAARVCPADGSQWVTISCKAGEKCTAGECKPVAGGVTAACVPGDGACLPTNQALRCLGDGSGYETVGCPAGTTCQNRGVCMGSFAVGSSTCTADRRFVNTFPDGFHATVTPCAANEYCVNLHTTAGGYPFNVAACKPAQCRPSAAGSICGEQSLCGDPSNMTNDQTKFVASCTETPAGFKWIGTACPAGQTCNPVGTQCSLSQGGQTQAACAGPTCTQGAQRCAPDGTGVQTCGADGRWGAGTACNLAAGERCFVVPGTSSLSLPRAVCGDPVCSVAGDGVCEANTGKLRACDANGKLTAAQACPVGRCLPFQPTGFSAPFEHTGRCVIECTPGQESCVNSGSYRVCDALGRWAGPIACPSPDGASAVCGLYSDAVTSLNKHVCITNADCTPGQLRCVAGDGGTGTDAVQSCGVDGRWQPPQVCATGACSSGSCLAQCIPGTPVCDPAGSGKYTTCPTNGVLPASPVYDQTCAGSMTCKRVAGRSFGCIECVGPNLTDTIAATTVEARCVNSTGGTGASHLQSCQADNTWGAPQLCTLNAAACVSSFPNSPAIDPGGVRTAYCN